MLGAPARAEQFLKRGAKADTIRERDDLRRVGVLSIHGLLLSLANGSKPFMRFLKSFHRAEYSVTFPQVALA
jgi:hypothetical protein